MWLAILNLLFGCTKGTPPLEEQDEELEEQDEELEEQD